ncbi:MAG: hypothetical protein ACLP8S_02450 [Solirubrobacteraceae bacterium]
MLLHRPGAREVQAALLGIEHHDTGEELIARVLAAVRHGADAKVALGHKAGPAWVIVSRALIGDPTGLPLPSVLAPWEDDPQPRGRSASTNRRCPRFSSAPPRSCGSCMAAAAFREPLERLVQACEELRGEFLQRARDRSGWGLAKSLVMQMLVEGIDPSAPGAMDAWMAYSNARPPEQRDAIIGPPPIA